MAKHIDLVGQVFGRLRVVSFNRSENHRRYWNCICDCGKEKITNTGILKGGKVKSCGCFQAESRESHTMSDSRPYRIWCKMKNRCDNPNNDRYEDYGGRGITYPVKWKTFEGFWEDMSEGYADNMSIDRIDVNAGYCKENCKWSTVVEQNRNQRMLSTNTSGITGVSISKGKYPHYISRWTTLYGEQKTKCFSIKKYGDELAFFMACEWRAQMISLLNLQGANYGKNHGKRG